MWKRSFIATTLAMGGTVDDALAAVGEPGPARDLVDALRARERAARAVALGGALAEVNRAIAAVTLR